MARFERKPAKIEAWQWSDSPEEKPDWLVAAEASWPEFGSVRMRDMASRHKGEVCTKTGIAIFRKGDWIVRTSSGELYPIKHDAFVKSYSRIPQ